ncbi:MAG: polymerase subunit gamma/tau [Flaviaesturariibacter sp.]|nr:polymerase subunit gamma/tau [Flaviaesturariibacter sp.]
MLFRDIIGQSDVKQHLVEMVQHNRLSHALLFLGKEGSGALPLAMAFAQYVTLLPNLSRQNTTEASLFGEPVEIKLPGSPEVADAWMESQPAFSKAQGLVHPDIHYAYPVIPKKPSTPPLSVDYISEWREFIQQLPYGNVYDWLQFIDAENKQGNITAQECNDIIRKLNLKSFESGYKTLVLWMPEYLGKEGNKLLKLIEEPPADTLFILVAESEAAILSTILSRCQLVKVPALESADIEKALITRAACSPDQAKSLANTADGNYREALHLLQHADEDFGALLKDWMNATLKNQPIVQVKLIEEIARLGREKQKQFLRYFTHLIEQAVRLEVMGSEQKSILLSAMSAAEQDFAQRLNKAMSLEQKEAIATELDKTAYHIERNANARILFHALTIRIFHIVKNNVVIAM